MNTTTSRTRRAQGLCIRCELATDGGIYCAEHHRIQQQYEANKW